MGPSKQWNKIIFNVMTNKHNEGKQPDILFLRLWKSWLLWVEAYILMLKGYFFHLCYPLVEKGWKKPEALYGELCQGYSCTFTQNKVHIDSCLGIVDSGVIYHRNSPDS